jgi:hypothetical protein
MTTSAENNTKELKDLVLGIREEMRVGFAALGKEIEVVKANQASTMTAITELSNRISATESRQFTFFMGVLGIVGTAFAGLLFKLLDFTKIPN